MSTINYCPRCGTQLSNTMNHCPECGLKIAGSDANKIEPLNEKKKLVLHGRAKRNNNKYWLGAAILAVVISIIIYNQQPTKEYKIIKEQPQVVNSVTYPASRYEETYTIAFARNNKIILPLDLVKEKKMVKFDYLANNGKVPLLAYLSEGGKVITAISMCEPCNSTDFHIQGSNLICNSCGTTWALNNLEAISGSCSKYPPDPVPSKVVGNEIQIDEGLVANWKRRV
ncbi:MAG: Fe-S-containing protein [Bacteroidota bacterium]